MIKYFRIHFKRKVYIGTIVPMPPVMDVRENLIRYSSNVKTYLAESFLE